MKKTTLPFKIVHLLALMLLAAGLVACQSGEEESTPAPTATPAQQAALTPTLAPTLAPPSVNVQDPPTATLAPTEEPEPTSTSPVPSPTPPFTPTPSPEPPPAPTFYTIQPGDSLIGIAEQFEVSIDALLFANGAASLDELFLVAGEELQIPLCEAHQVTSGNTLSGIAQLCGVTLDELVIENIAILAPLGTLDAVPIGFVLRIPKEIDLTADPDCSEQPEREQVIEYTPRQSEGLYCLAQKFSVSTTTIIQANTQRLTGSSAFGVQPLLIPPTNGAVYVVTAEDIENGVTLEDIAFWYDVTVDLIVDWNGNPVTEIAEGTQIFIPGANLAFGPYQFIPPEDTGEADGEGEAEATATPEA